jgi:hypothetical protein
MGSAKRARVHFSGRTLQFRSGGADIRATMRTLGFRSHVLLAFAAAVGVVAALGRPWYAPAPPPVDDEFTSIGSIHGPVNALSGSLSRLVGE